MTQQHSPITDMVRERTGDHLVAVEDLETNYHELLAVAEVASRALHEFHQHEYSIPVGRGICTWKPCQALFQAITKATSPQAR